MCLVALFLGKFKAGRIVSQKLRPIPDNDTVECESLH